MLSRSIGFRRACWSFALLACNTAVRPYRSYNSPLTSTSSIVFVSGLIVSSPYNSNSNSNNRLVGAATSGSSSSFLAMSTSAGTTTTSDALEGVDISKQLQEVRDNVEKACKSSGRNIDEVQLVAVSKTKPLELIQEAYKCGQRIFGENYAQELVDKAGKLGEETSQDQITWHFIGGLQSNKANMLVKGVVPHGKLVVETVSSLKVANKLNNAMSENFENQILDVFVQVNTSGEGSKSGITPDNNNQALVELCQHIQKECHSLNLKGLMTIGAVGDVSCFDTLLECRSKVASTLGIDDEAELGLSMGMSGDYESAISKGSTNIRVGSTIFGARDYSNK